MVVLILLAFAIYENRHVDYVQEMLASYTDVRTRPCVKCSRLLDRNGRFPVVRAKKIWKTEEGQPGEWSALHSSCA